MSNVLSCSKMTLRLSLPNSWLLLLTLLKFSACWTRTGALRELIPPRPLPPLTSPPPPLFAGPPLQPTTITVPPVFQQENNTELSSQVGTTAVLHCPTEHVGENTVSWVRRRDYHLLTVGLIVYSSDQRFSVRYINNEKVTDLMDWQLHIRYVQKRDEGVYECQIATHPPISLLSTLHVVEATSEILGGPEKYMTTGSSLRLVCVLRKNTQPPSYVFWYLGDRMINYDTKVKVDTGGEVSVLFLGEVGPQSSGNYSCVPSNAQSSHILVHVLRGGETPAAIHSGSTAVIQPSSWLHSEGWVVLLSKYLPTALLIIRNYQISSMVVPGCSSGTKSILSDTFSDLNQNCTTESDQLRPLLSISKANSSFLDCSMFPRLKHSYEGYFTKPQLSIHLKSTEQNTLAFLQLDYFIHYAAPAILFSMLIVFLHCVIFCKILLQDSFHRAQYINKNYRRPQGVDYDLVFRRRGSNFMDFREASSFKQVPTDCKESDVKNSSPNTFQADLLSSFRTRKSNARSFVGKSCQHFFCDDVECSIKMFEGESPCMFDSPLSRARFKFVGFSGAGNSSTEQCQ